MRILITGRQGQIARSLVERGRAEEKIELITAARPQVDLAEPGSLSAAITALRPDVVINAAAYTSVDRAETEQELALRINALAAGEGAEAATRIGARFIQLSTDYVFDGSGDRAWREEDSISPLNAYGRTKAEGERLVLAAGGSHLVVRTSWIVSPFGNNFVRTLLRVAADRDEVAVVNDQTGSPTSAPDLAVALVVIARLAYQGEAGGIYHLAGGGEASWAELAEFVVKVSEENGGPSAKIRRIPSAEFLTLALRPAYSVLNCSKAQNELGIVLPSWMPSVRSITSRLLGGETSFH